MGSFLLEEMMKFNKKIIFEICVLIAYWIFLIFIAMHNIDSQAAEKDIGNGIRDELVKLYVNKFVFDVNDISVMQASTKLVQESIEAEKKMSDIAVIEKVEYSDDIRLLAQLVIAEAEGEPFEGQRMVADVVLNRVDYIGFPNDIRSVIYQPGQFSCISDGRFDRCKDLVTEEILEWVYAEQYERLSWLPLYFRTEHYHEFGTPVCHIGNHYFSE